MRTIFHTIHITNAEFYENFIPFPANENNRTLNIALFRLGFLSARKMYFSLILTAFDSTLLWLLYDWFGFLFCFFFARLTQRQSIDKWKFEPSYERHVNLTLLRLCFFCFNYFLLSIFLFRLFHRSRDSIEFHRREISCSVRRVHYLVLTFCGTHRCESMIMMHDYSCTNRTAVKGWIK